MNLCIRRPNSHIITIIGENGETDEFTPGEVIEFCVTDVPGWHELAAGHGSPVMIQSDWTAGKIPDYGTHDFLIQPNGGNQIPQRPKWTLKPKGGAIAKPATVANLKDLQDAIAAGARDITVTNGITLPAGEYDFKGALLKAGPGVKDILATGNDGVTIRHLAFRSNVKQFGIELRHNSVAENVTIDHDNPGDGIRASGKLVVIRGLNATTFARYAVFGEGAGELHIIDSKIDGGSKTEAVYRSHRVRKQVMSGNRVNHSIPGKAILRIHDNPPDGVVGIQGEHYTCHESVTAIGIGPLGRGDGGQEVGIAQWRDGNYSQDQRVQAIRKALEMTAAGRDRLSIATECAKIGGKSAETVHFDLSRRTAMLAYRTLNVQISDSHFGGPVVLNAGCNAVFVNCKIHAADRAFVQWVASYPEPAWMPNNEPLTAPLRITGDSPRPMPIAVFDQCDIRGKSLGITPKDWPTVRFDRSTFNGQAVAA